MALFGKKDKLTEAEKTADSVDDDSKILEEESVEETPPADETDVETVATKKEVDA